MEDDGRRLPPTMVSDATFADVGHGMQKRIDRLGDGTSVPAPGSDLWVHYSCLLLESRSHVDSSRGDTPTTSSSGLTILKKARPHRFTLGDGNVIPAWEAALPTMTLGERATFHFSADICYGAAGKAPAVPPNSALEYDLELVGVDGKYCAG